MEAEPLKVTCQLCGCKYEITFDVKPGGGTGAPQKILCEICRGTLHEVSRPATWHAKRVYPAQKPPPD